MAPLTREELAKQISRRYGVSFREARRVINHVFLGITRHLSSGGDCSFRDFGNFKLVHRKAKTGRNPKNPSEEFEIPAHIAVSFTPSRLLKKQVLTLPAAA